MDKWKKGELIAKLDCDLELVKFVTFAEAEKGCFENLQIWRKNLWGSDQELSLREKNELYMDDKIKFYRGFGYYTYESYENTVINNIGCSEFYNDNKKIENKNKVVFGYYGRC